MCTFSSSHFPPVFSIFPALLDFWVFLKSKLLMAWPPVWFGSLSLFLCVHCLFIFKHGSKSLFFSLSDFFSGTRTLYYTFCPLSMATEVLLYFCSSLLATFSHPPLFLLPGSHDLRLIVTAAFMIDYRLELYDTHARMRACHKSPSKSLVQRSSIWVMIGESLIIAALKINRGLNESDIKLGINNSKWSAILIFCLFNRKLCLRNLMNRKIT